MNSSSLPSSSPTYRLLTPGPVPLPPFVLDALARPMIHHRTPEFDAILKRVLAMLQQVFVTHQPVMILTSTGSGAMEAAISNTLALGDEVLCIDSGKFGERWYEMAMVYGLKAHHLKVPWGESVDVAKVAEILNTNPEIKAVLTQACETSTATLQPIRQLSDLTRERPKTLLLVDAITALGATELPMDDWGIDVLLTGAQKAMMLPTGLSFISLSQKAWRASERCNLPRYYFDLRKERAANEKGQTFLSSAVSHIVALERVLKFYELVGLTNMQDRCLALSEATQAAAVEMNLKIFSKSPSPSVTAIEVPKSVDGVALRTLLELNYGVTVMGGQDQLTGKILRIGHLGAIQDEDMIAFVEALGLALNRLQSGCISQLQIQSAREKMLTRLHQGPKIDYGFSN